MQKYFKSIYPSSEALSVLKSLWHISLTDGKYFQYYMEHGEEIQLAESGKIQVFYTYFLCNCMSEKNCLKHCWGGSTVGYWTSRRSLCIVIVCRLSLPIGADRGKCGVLGIIGNGGGGLSPQTHQWRPRRTPPAQ